MLGWSDAGCDLDAAARRVRKELGAAGLEVIELPMLFTAAVGKAEVTRLSRSLRNQVARVKRSFIHGGTHRLLLCLGPGGVGKTTTASALALRARWRAERLT